MTDYPPCCFTDDVVFTDNVIFTDKVKRSYGNIIPVVFQDTACDWLPHMDAQRYQLVEQRVVGQLLQTLLYEDVLPYRRTPIGDGNSQFAITGRDAQQVPVEYRCNGLFSDSFDLIRLDYASVRRIGPDGDAQSPNLHQMLEELLGEQESNPFLTRFVQELEQTQLKDLQSRAQDYQPGKPAHQLSFDQLERHFMDAHSYHPCYKSRIGFSLQDNAQWGPEFGQPFAIVWLALAKPLASANHSSNWIWTISCKPNSARRAGRRLANSWRVRGAKRKTIN